MPRQKKMKECPSGEPVPLAHAGERPVKGVPRKPKTLKPKEKKPFVLNPKLKEHVEGFNEQTNLYRCKCGKDIKKQGVFFHIAGKAHCLSLKIPVPPRAPRVRKPKKEEAEVESDEREDLDSEESVDEGATECCPSKTEARASSTLKPQPQAEKKQ
jgi:hypothetical protein